jgi:hypothetical protein
MNPIQCSYTKQMRILYGYWNTINHWTWKENNRLVIKQSWIILYLKGGNNWIRTLQKIIAMKWNKINMQIIWKTKIIPKFK